MGLDITAYSRLEPVDVVYDADGFAIDPVTREEVEDVADLRANPDFPGRNAPFPSRVVCRYADALGFRAGSYGGYSEWRDQLAKMLGWPNTPYEKYGKQWDSHANSAWRATSGPMWELICFSDCEGFIGADACKKLAREFAEHQAKADEQDDYFREKYAEWRAAFELAADGGAVQFH